MENNDPATVRGACPPNRHDGIFPTGTFIISNHADELSPWTPLLASLSSSPFLCIPCCAHNLSGQRFRAPSASNGYKANSAAPAYFAPQISKAKHVPIGGNSPNMDSRNKHHGGLGHLHDQLNGSEEGVEQGDLKSLRHARHTEKSSYSSLCDWIVHLAEECGFAVEKRVLDSPSQRNLAIVGRPWRQGFASKTLDERQDLVKAIVKRENVNYDGWMERCNILVKGKEGLSVH